MVRGWVHEPRCHSSAVVWVETAVVMKRRVPEADSGVIAVTLDVFVVMLRLLLCLRKRDRRWRGRVTVVIAVSVHFPRRTSPTAFGCPSFFWVVLVNLKSYERERERKKDKDGRWREKKAIPQALQSEGKIAKKSNNNGLY